MTRSDSCGNIVNALTIDVEDYFQVSAFAAHISRKEWDTLPCRVEQNVDRVLTLLRQRQVSGSKAGRIVLCRFEASL